MSARGRRAAGAVVVGLLALIGASPLAQAATTNSGAFVLSAKHTGSGYAPTFTGNGLLGVRVPPAGQGYAGGTVPAQSELAGFYAKPSKGKAPERVQQRANIPSWSTLSFADEGRTFTPFTVGRTSGWRQSIDLRTGVISTSGRWRAPDGHVTGLAYQVFTDRAREHVAVVRLTLRPRWTGTATVTDAIDGTADRVTGPKLPPVLTTQTGKAWNLPGRAEWVSVRTLGTGITAALADQLVPSSNVTASSQATDRAISQSVGQRISFPVTAGQTYTLTKYVGVEDSQTATDPVASAQLDAAGAATSGDAALLAENDAAWASLWRGRIDVGGNRTVATDVNASEFYLWSSTRDDQAWSVSPAGLSSNGYDGHIFWDAETWMFPSLLAQHPDLAQQMEAYRFDRLSAAQRHAAATGSQGARFPWESALNGTEQIPPPVSVNSEGLYEQHITADIALAQWQYYEATGDVGWLRTDGWPVLSGAATFWASRAQKGAHGSFHISHVTGPDEENPNVADEAFTNVGAKTTLRDAIAAGHILGKPIPAKWSTVARGLVVPVTGGIHPEYAGYQNQLVKQADVTLLQYPWAFPMKRSVASADLNFYVPRTDPGGPSMDDAVSSIDTSQLLAAGCSSYVYTLRSYEPYIRDPFDQFSETRTGGAFTFMTGIGGFLQEFLYGYSGLRWQRNSVRLAPVLNAGLGTITLHRVAWHGSLIDIAIGPKRTTVTLDSGPSVPLDTPGGRRIVATARPVTVDTARPDLRTTPDLVRCDAAQASSALPGAPALAAVDGSPATDWQPAKLPATLTLPLAQGRRTVTSLTLNWGHAWPAEPKPNVHPKAEPITILSPTRYVVQASTDNFRWFTVATITGSPTAKSDEDRITFPAVHAADIRVRVLSGLTPVTSYMNSKPVITKETPMLQEISVR